MSSIVKNFLKIPAPRFIAPLSTKATNTLNEVSTKTTQSPPALAEKDRLYSKLEIELRGIDPAVLKSYTKYATTAANHLGLEVGKCWSPLKAHHSRMTLLKSVHIYKKHRVQYEVRTHFRYMNFHKLTESTLSTFLEYIERNLPEGVALNATKTELQTIPEHLRQPPSDV
ncbi:28S ribosomal protein S10, mitochondrial [Teleopsis dalmanni]|uniref:28S ribosomal protein S10, mitochondrial n=1 Tax=Teleopsis dalmanni TaxID=139649 RepID=UPI0018CE3E82|nr:28S ribosomal protein S10, mitochondrial [Teleopsis dalmanni]